MEEQYRAIPSVFLNISLVPQIDQYIMKKSSQRWWLRMLRRIRKSIQI